jgi:very-short-patch-repair endonuclease
MVWLVAILVLAIVLGALVKRDAESGHWPLEAKRPLTTVEQKLYWRLTQSLPDNPVLAQVQLSRIMAVKRVPKRQAWLNRIDRKSADFVVCNKDFSVAAVIELDDSSHDSAVRHKADADKDAALKAAGIPIIRWNVKSMPDGQSIRRVIASMQKNG